MRINFHCSDQEWEHLKDAAALKKMSASAYIKSAINESLIKQGFDSVLFRYRGDSSFKND